MAKTGNDDLAVLVCEVLANNPELAMWEERWAADEAEAGSPATLGPTKLSYAFAPASIPPGGVAYGQVVTLEQSFRLAQRGIESRAMRARAAADAHDWEAQRQEMTRLVSSLYAEYYASTRALEINAAHAALVRDLHELALTTYAAGRGRQQDPIAAELELAHVEHERLLLEAQRDVVVAQINGLRGRDPGDALPEPPLRLGADEADHSSAAVRPELEAAQARTEASAHDVTVARRRFVPSLSAMASYNSMWHSTAHQFMVGVGVSIPLQISSMRSRVDAAQARERVEARRTEAIEDRVAVEQHVADRRLDAALQVVEVHEQRLIPSARDRAEATQVAYETGEAPFNDVIEAERELRRLELDAERARASVLTERANLHRAEGVAAACEGGSR